MYEHILVWAASTTSHPGSSASASFMYEHILAWAGLALLLFLCLPFSGTRKLVLELYAWAVRLALLALLAGGAVLWFRPERLPPEVLSFVDSFPRLREVLPEPGAPTFGIALAALASAVLLPILAMLDVTRKLAGDRLCRLRALTEAARPAGEPAPADPRRPAPASGAQKRPDRRAAADTMAEAGSRKPFRVADHLS
jgi:hypothetical protein